MRWQMHQECKVDWSGWGSGEWEFDIDLGHSEIDWLCGYRSWSTGEGFLRLEGYFIDLRTREGTHEIAFARKTMKKVLDAALP